MLYVKNQLTFLLRLVLKLIYQQQLQLNVYGFYQADSGTININGKKVNLKSPRDSIENGIGMVHQHFMLVENFSVLENIILGFEGEIIFGKKVEEAAVNELFSGPRHPYTQGLLASIPRLDDNDVEDRAALNEIEGTVPSLASLGPGCAFAPRCSYADTECWSICPPLEEKHAGHWAACWHTDRLIGLDQ